MSKFYVPERVNFETAKEGVWFDIVDDAGIDYGSYKCRYLDPFSDALDLEKKKLWARHGCNNTNKKQDQKRTRLVMAHLLMLDWKLPTDPNDENAKPIQFTPDDAFEFLSLDSTSHIFVELARLVSNNANFVGDAEENEAEEVEGN